MMRINKILFFSIFSLMLLMTSSVFCDEVADRLQRASSYILTINEERRLEAKISLDFMNRIAVLNDRIVNIFGDEGTFVVQTDEVTGQVFIKPTAENASQPLSITLITENGITQDLSLIPIQSNAATLILKPKAILKEASIYQSLPGLRSHNSTLQEEWLRVMKQAVLEELPVSYLKNVPNRKVYKFNLHYVKSYQSNNYLVQVWLVKNNSKELQKLEEKNFFNPGDLALSLQKHSLEPNDKTTLYILGTI